MRRTVTVVEDTAYIAGRNAEGFGKAGDTCLHRRRLLIASGSVPSCLLPGEGGVDTGFVMTNREILDLEEVPNRLVIVGGGVIAGNGI